MSVLSRVLILIVMCVFIACNEKKDVTVDGDAVNDTSHIVDTDLKEDRDPVTDADSGAKDDVEPVADESVDADQVVDNESSDKSEPEEDTDRIVDDNAADDTDQEHDTHPDDDVSVADDADPVCECTSGDECCSDGCNFDPENTPCGDNASACVNADVCSSNGVCIDKGFAVDGTACGDSDQCVEGVCLDCFDDTGCIAQAHCGESNTCVCDTGYAGDGSICLDIDGCTNNTCFEGVECFDIPAPDPGMGYTCGECPAGYEGNGETCSDIDGCANDPCDAGVTCTDVPAPGVGYICGDCPTGFEYNAGTCIDLDECALGTDTCDENATCTNSCGGFTCTCNEGYLGDGVTCEELSIVYDTCYGLRSDDPASCGEHGTCVADDTCQCAVGYYTVPSTPSAYCQALLWCDGDGDCSGNGDCIDQHDNTGVGVCECYDRYFGSDCADYLVCPDNGGYAFAYEGVDLCGDYGDCELDPDNPTSQLGICVCEDYVYGDECQDDTRYCNGYWYLDDEVCNGFGSCEYSETDGEFSCVCRDGYDGFTCSAAECYTTINGVCNGQGACVKDFDCRCKAPYTVNSWGNCVRLSVCNGLRGDDPNVCNGHGSCVHNACECDPGYGGPSCLKLECLCDPGYDTSYAPDQQCAVCLPGYDPEQNCAACLPGYDPEQNCQACAPGYNCYSNCIDTVTCVDGVCTDPGTCFQWQETPTGGTMYAESAITHCENLDLEGVGWRLPNISELRTLVRNCSEIETGGSCQVVDECSLCGVAPEDTCITSSCESSDVCNPSSCSDDGGPTGCYWPQELSGSCDMFWSSSSYETGGMFPITNFWSVAFQNGFVDDAPGAISANARCMREGPSMCYGHGQQEDGSCVCDEGYDPDQNCGACAEHYLGYPNCIPKFECTDGVCIDGKTGLEWQETPAVEDMTWASAITHCEELDLNGGGWRLPNISELRSLVRYNASLETGGACGVVDACASCGVVPEDICLEYSCKCSDPECKYTRCVADKDLRSFNYCFWPQALGEACDGYFWSSSPDTSYTDRAWIADFNVSALTDNYKTTSQKVRCVRGGE